MSTLIRLPENPILLRDASQEWEHDGAFNGSVAFAGSTYHLVYRALSSEKEHQGVKMQVSSIGYAKSEDGIHFKDRRLLIEPAQEWEKYGCEDPRITYLDGKFYIFYTALSSYPFTASGIRLGMAITSDFKTFRKYPITPFNSKAMALFPEKIDGKLAAVLTVNTDLPPAKIGLALFNEEKDLYSPDYWKQWYANINVHIIHLLDSRNDQIEVGAPPLKTDHGWILVYANIENYRSGNKKFSIEAALLDLGNPRKILGKTTHPLLIPENNYEFMGNVPEIVFPTGAVLKDKKIFVYYGAADISTAVASGDLNMFLNHLKPVNNSTPGFSPDLNKFVRFEGNPLLAPYADLDWQAKGTFNPAAIYEDGKFHFLYRARGEDGTSVFGYANSRDGFHLEENLNNPVYTPHEDFEIKTSPKNNSGCEDPRLTKIGERFYLTYTAYNGNDPPRVALTSIAISDFLQKYWLWEKPKLISPPDTDDKDACIIKNSKGEGYLAFHRLGDGIWLDLRKDLDFPEKKYLSGTVIARERKDNWDNTKVGIAGPPFETEQGWILFYHSVCEPGFAYKIGAMLLDFADPRKILARTDEPLLEPERKYELEGQVEHVVFSCGSVILDGVVYLYYGGADKVSCVATLPLKSLIEILLKNRLY